MPSESTLFFCLQHDGLAPLATKMDDLRNWKGLVWPSLASGRVLTVSPAELFTMHNSTPSLSSTFSSIRSRVTDTGMDYTG